MRAVKILHCADLHLGARLKNLGSRAAKRQQDYMKTLELIVTVCKEEEIQLLLIAGDLFDSSKQSNELLEEVRALFASIPDTYIAVAPGNHDPATVDSCYEKKGFWSDNVIIFSGEMTDHEIPALGVRLWGAGMTEGYSLKSLFHREQSIREAAAYDDEIQIGVLHGDLISAGGRSEYNPVYKEDIRDCGLQYLALGHIHKRSEPEWEGSCCYAYSGSTEGLGFDETGEKGVYIGLVTKSSCSLSFFPVCQRRFVRCEIDISTVTGTKQAAAFVRSFLQVQQGERFERHLYDIKLKGEQKNIWSFDAAAFLAEFDDVFYMKVREQRQLSCDLEQLADEISLRGIFARRMLLIKDKISKDQFETAVQIGLKAMNGRVDYSEDYET